MIVDALLSGLHFLLAFSLVAILAAQGVLIRPGITASGLRLAAQLDRAYGASAALLLGIGFGRVFYGAKGAVFYLSNPMFWVKLLLFAAVAVLSIPPTVQLIRWTRQARLQANFAPSTSEVSHLQRWLFSEGLVLVFIPLVAAAMARGLGH